MRAHYSVIQYCPDRGRDERLNVGLVVITDCERLLAKVSPQSMPRVSATFGLNDDATFNALWAAESTVYRIIEDVRTLDELKEFAVTRANDIRLTIPRLCKIDDLDADFDRLFAELVEWKGE